MHMFHDIDDHHLIRKKKEFFRFYFDIKKQKINNTNRDDGNLTNWDFISFFYFFVKRFFIIKTKTKWNLFLPYSSIVCRNSISSLNKHCGFLSVLSNCFEIISWSFNEVFFEDIVSSVNRNDGGYFSVWSVPSNSYLKKNDLSQNIQMFF